MKHGLNDLAWELKGFYPYVPLLANSVETGEALKGVTAWMPATVPGAVQHDLYRAGYIQDPHRDLNSLSCEWVEHRWWMYRTSFARPARLGRTVELVCKGLDYKAHVFLNNVPLGEHEGMFVPAVFDITAIAREHETLELRILFEHAPQEQSQIGRTSLTHTQKSRFGYKWDFSARLVSLGIWDDIYLRVRDAVSIGETHVRTDVGEDGAGIVGAAVRIERVGAGTGAEASVGAGAEADVGASAGAEADEEASAEASAEAGAEVDAQAESYTAEAVLTDPEGRVLGTQRIDIGPDEAEAAFSFRLEQPRLWYPNGHGEQPLYGLTIRILADGAVVDERAYRPGIRKLAYMHNERSPDDALPYTFVVNGEKVYVKGVNLTPLDLLYGCVTPERYEWTVIMMKHAGVNLVRVWGGGVIEKSVFYELCDRHGILVWQEFVQSGSGMDSIPPKDPAYLALLGAAAEAAIKDRRNYVSLASWSGGNELKDKFNKPCGYGDDNLALLKALVEAHDPDRMFLPTSASGPEEMISLEDGKNHDVHGGWKYRGHPEHYEFYGQADSLFHSEFGVDGLCAVKSMRKFLSPPHIRVTDMDESLAWRHHGDWWDTRERDAWFFGEPEGIDAYARRSQWIQAEGLRYIVESNRRKQFRNSGSIVWQFNEPWPNVGCTSLTDYYGEGKMAYYWIRQAYAPAHASLDYSRLVYPVGDTFVGDLFVGSGNGMPDGVIAEVEVRSTDGRRLWHGRYPAEPVAGMRKAAEVAFGIAPEFTAMFIVQLRLMQGDRALFENAYYFSTQAESCYRPAEALDASGFGFAPAGEWEEADVDLRTEYLDPIKRTFRLTNEGAEAVLHVYPEELTDRYWVLADEGFVTLFPGEEKIVTVYCARRRPGGLSADPGAEEAPARLPDIVFRHLNAGDSQAERKVPHEQPV
ncbi:glycoside hydrolase family 2 protein [Cohnella sp. JJ-181]|uniref:glycoside hydrolase family 2 protein n=1 Tax=Cohnella rhizoplanae TaxID=2974897 RepID=UPI0022FFB2D8|nr:glycoside hydrolase family 2 TIM barrel-domain containing protein [Cohnella sp. JJ-181]CAI6083150.1 Exo-beta-D-glucosaminidase [Cohnella sp. JJ-181]